MFDFIIFVNKFFLLKESIINILKIIWYEKYSIVFKMVKIQVFYVKKKIIVIWYLVYVFMNN